MDATRLYLSEIGFSFSYPFQLIDNHEFWLLDEALQPLALLDSAIDPHDMDSDQPLQWRPGMRCQETFRSGAVSRCTNPGSTTSAAEALAEHIRERSGQQPKAQWFHRPDHSLW